MTAMLCRTLVRQNLIASSIEEGQRTTASLVKNKREPHVDIYRCGEHMRFLILETSDLRGLSGV